MMRQIWALFLILASAGVLSADDNVDYLRDIKPIFTERCIACHGALKQESDLRLDAGALIRKGGGSGSAVDPGDPAASLLIERVSAEDEYERMPPEGKPLSPAQIAKLRAWIEQGAKSPADERPEPDPREHWAFRVPERPPVPALEDAVRNAWVRNPIDASLAARHAQRGLSPRPPADKHVLLRRAFLDLTGLPPTREQLHEFLADDSDEAYEKVVDRLLETPQYGERWGRHWMDVWRYSDWYGRREVPDVMNSYPHIWRWRDWIVRSLNEDKGYDRMLSEMLAGDEIAPDDDEIVVATGYLVRNWFKWNYNQWMKDTVEHTGKAFLGLTFNCAHCHDHKYDPITHEEYFAFRAFFEPLELRQDRAPGLPDPGPFEKYVYGKAYGPIKAGMVRVFDEKLDAETHFYTGGDARNKVDGRPPIAPGVPAVFGDDALQIEPVELPAVAWYPGLKPFVQQEEIAARQQAVASAERELNQARSATEEKLPDLAAAVTRAEEELAAAQIAAESNAAPTDEPGALEGVQSLLIDAQTGRRTLFNRLDAWKAGVGDGTQVSFQLRIITDGHVNLQLGRDVTTGTTAGWVGFEKGSILTYSPGTFNQITVGRYDAMAGQNTFDVRLRFDVTNDRFALTVQCREDGEILVEEAAAALNGWNPQEANSGLFLDVRPGTVVAFDAIALASADGAALLNYDFEPEKYTAGEDAVGIDGWSVSPYSAAPATSKVARHIAAPPQVVQLEAKLQAARRALATQRMAVSVAEAKLAAAQADLNAIEARIAADRARHLDRDGNPQVLAREAKTAEWQAKLAAAKAKRAAAEQALAVAQLKPESDMKRAAEIQAAQQSAAAADKEIGAAEQALADSAGVDAQNENELADYSPLSPVYPTTSTGRRTALANWLTDEKNPLTARVAVNHIWMRHFGAPLVESMDNFGRSGSPPTHPELLDWLAVEFMESGWSMKHLHRLIMTSNAYRMSSTSGDGETPEIALDPDNRDLWRFNVLRMEAEVVRDSMLHVAGRLDPTMGGQELDHKEGLTSARRSLYFASHGQSQMPFLELFDAPNVLECYQRNTSIVPQQALALVNSELSLAQSRVLARTLWEAVAANITDESEAESAFVQAAFEQVLSRPPTESEAALSLEFLARQREFFKQVAPEQLVQGKASAETGPSSDPALRARENLIQGLFNHNDFVTIR
jgi:mono/diheme cytochrome c family protein